MHHEQFNFQRVFTHPQGETIQNQAIAIVVFNTDGEILIIRHAQAKPAYGRNIGDWGIITGTREHGEGPRNTFWRELNEETGIKRSDVLYCPGSYVQRKDEQTHCLTRCIAVIYKRDAQEFVTNFQPNTEIETCVWVSQDKQDVYQLEEEAKLLLDWYKDQQIAASIRR